MEMKAFYLDPDWIIFCSDWQFLAVFALVLADETRYKMINLQNRIG